MRITILALLLLFSIKAAIALEAVVTVLETPMLSEKNLNSQAVQYLRKGDVVKIQGVMGRRSRYAHLAPPPEKLKALSEEIENDPSRFDPMFSGKPRLAVDPEQDEFVPVMSRQGHISWVLAEHLYFYYEDTRELAQTTIQPDPTDYRLEEPLSPNYPLATPVGYRGQGILGVTQPYTENYPYRGSILAKGYMTPVDFNYTIMRNSQNDQQDRFFYGATLGLRFLENSYLLSNLRTSEETMLKIGLGPYLNYDAYKGVKNRLALYGSLNFNLFNQLTISQSDSNRLRESRTYRSITIAPRLGTQYHRKNILEDLDLDLVLGTYLEFETPAHYRASSPARIPAWWREQVGDSFTTRPVFAVIFYLGFQTAY
jgi:hypothetical protein